jgi:hypothetical protein
MEHGSHPTTPPLGGTDRGRNGGGGRTMSEIGNASESSAAPLVILYQITMPVTNRSV